MRKRMLAAFMSALLMVTFTACSDGPDADESSEPSSSSADSRDNDTSPTDTSSDNTSSEDYENMYSLAALPVPEGAGPLLKSGMRAFLDKMDKDKFSLKYSIECLTEDTDGKVRSAENTIYRDGSRLSSVLAADDEESGINKQIIKDSKVYEIDDANKTVTWMNIESYIIDAYVYNTAGVFYVDSLEFCGSGKEKIGGKEYDYEEYKPPEGSDDTSSSEYDEQRARYYFENGEIAGLKHTSGGYYYTTMVLELGESVPKGEFDYPSGYKLEERLELSDDTEGSAQSQQ